MLEFVLAALAVYRLSVLFTEDDGPGDLLFIVRDYLGAYDWGIDRRAKSTIGRLISCPRCLSVWLAMPAAVWLWWADEALRGDWSIVVLAWLGISGTVLLMVEVTNGVRN